MWAKASVTISTPKTFVLNEAVRDIPQALQANVGIFIHVAFSFLSKSVFNNNANIRPYTVQFNYW
jgi:hypothetical protein